MQKKTYAESKEYIKNTLKSATDPEIHSQQIAGTISSPVGSPDNPSTKMLTIPNIITLCRFILVLVFMILYIGEFSRFAALACYVIAALTDFLDGFIARATKSVSWTGKIMDPIMDRLLLLCGLVALLVEKELPLWVALLLILRDLYLAVGSVIVRHFLKRPIDVVYVGKAATALLLVGFSDLLLGMPQIQGLALCNLSWLYGFTSDPVVVGIFLVYAGMICSAIATVIYTKKTLAIIHSRKASEVKAAV